jgi:hypothetical protein
MRCPTCQTGLVRETRNGQTMLKNRGLLIKGGQLVMVCPKCKGDVHPTPDVMRTLQAAAVLFFSPPS